MKNLLQVASLNHERVVMTCVVSDGFHNEVLAAIVAVFLLALTSKLA